MESQRFCFGCHRRRIVAQAAPSVGGQQTSQKCWHYLMMVIMLLISSTLALPISPTTTTTTTEQPLPSPFKYSYAAGRAPGGKPDRYVEQEGNGSGQIRGSYTYLDPNWTWQTIKYMADPDGGFRILEGSSLGLLPKDTAAVQKAKEEHEALFKMIAQRNEQLPTQPLQPQVVVPVETYAVQESRRQHAELFQKIAEEHRRLAEEHKRLAEVRKT